MNIHYFLKAFHRDQFLKVLNHLILSLLPQFFSLQIHHQPEVQLVPFDYAIMVPKINFATLGIFHDRTHNLNSHLATRK